MGVQVEEFGAAWPHTVDSIQAACESGYFCLPDSTQPFDRLLYVSQLLQLTCITNCEQRPRLLLCSKAISCLTLTDAPCKSFKRGSDLLALPPTSAIHANNTLNMLPTVRELKMKAKQKVYLTPCCSILNN